MKVKFANRIYDVLFTKELAGLTMYAVEDELNHIDWLINVEVVDAEKKELKKVEQKPVEWNPQPGDIFRKKGTEKPTYTLCSRGEDKITYGFVENREEGIAGGDISIFSLQENYELVERLRPIEEVIGEEFNKQLNQLKKTKKNNQELTWFKKFLCNITNLGKPDEKELEELKSNAKGLLKIARKQIASEIDVEDMVEEKKDSLNLEKDAYFAFGAYRKGIEDTLKKIKEG